MLTRRRPTGDRGTTLTELLVTMALMTIVGAMALGFFVWTGRAAQNTASASFTGQSARTAVSTIAGYLRLAQPGSVVDPTGTNGLTTRVTFLARDAVRGSCGNRPASSFSVAVSGGALTVTRTGPQDDPTTTQPCRYRAGVVTQRVLLDDVATGSGFRLLTAGAFATASPTAVATPTSDATTAIEIVVKVGGSGQRAQTYSTTAVVSGGAT